RLMQMSSSYHKEGRPLDIEYKIVRPDGQIRFIHGISDSFNEKVHKENIRYGAAMDITESKLQQIELLKTLEALERSNRDLEQFAYVASHDLQEPLRMVSTYSTMLQRKLSNDLDDKTKQYMGILIESSKRMNSLIQGLLDFSRIDSAKQEFYEVDLNVLLSDVLKDLSVSIVESKAEIKIDKLPSIKISPLQIKQLFQNLIANAIKFRGNEDPFVEVKAVRIDGVVKFSIKDNGIGIAPEFYDKIFVIFQRLHNREEYEGTGIGLSICKRIVEHHGGRIWVESEPGVGTTFYFTLSLNK
ncbi:MAG: ATP-binding protein, partial [Bacteroidota bacterium]|nr:ATP-binding protein [Bacteroidota bacterium]